MTTTKVPLAPGLGELLRYVTELLDGGSEERYADLGVSYRARYTPVLRAIAAGAVTVTEITELTRLTQGAVSQTAGLMISDGIISRSPMSDGRKSELRLTDSGEALLAKVSAQWELIFSALDELEKEIGHPLRRVLMDAADALERRGFADRLRTLSKRERKQRTGAHAR
ncbi:MarR family transcriptional regulator [Corallococcus sp. AB032C]|uniref:MarR family winged helix-turn-helix transcriptional regulator n=1 Tax=Corallococcus TaxID=83461 RepID=UPI000EBB871C|nr:MULTISPECIES: MarR family transcriptional regulator [Corallococcus]NNB89332.1 MarR family transcriptional regulator [Corallococcus exiguus]NPC51076.1 MarR family transcriptional regulator [Corallococcus exiguus]RKH79038.1 MarR family transcriptional regulator [Corallococcus sp. AB032C]